MTKDARTILDRFGSAPDCAAALNAHSRELFPDGHAIAKPIMINLWKYRGKISGSWYPALLHAAAAVGVQITAEELVNHLRATPDSAAAEAA